MPIKKSDKTIPEVLIIDDNPKVYDGFHKFLKHKYKVIGVTSGEKALDKIGERTHCIVLDVKMKGLNGFETYSAIKKRYSRKPIIFYTAFQDEHDLVDVINRFKPFGYVKKGLDPSMINNLIDDAVAHYKLHMENKRFEHELKDANSALRVLIKSVEAEKNEIQENIINEIKILILPHIIELDKHIKGSRGQRLYKLILNNINQIETQNTGIINYSKYGLTETEINIANLIKCGSKTKEIANISGTSVKTIDYHRANIRKKLGIKNTSNNLKKVLNNKMLFQKS